jgi:hypothetical protein
VSDAFDDIDDPGWLPEDELDPLPDELIVADDPGWADDQALEPDTWGPDELADEDALQGGNQQERDQ